MAFNHSYGTEKVVAAQDIDQDLLVKLDNNDELVPTDDTGDEIQGVLTQSVDEGDEASPQRGAVDYVTVDQDVDAGVLLMPSGANPGQARPFADAAGNTAVARALTSADSGGKVRVEVATISKEGS